MSVGITGNGRRGGRGQQGEGRGWEGDRKEMTGDGGNEWDVTSGGSCRA